MVTNDFDFDVFDAHCGASGHPHGSCCGELPPGAPLDSGLGCTRSPGHPGDHIVGDVLKGEKVYARWARPTDDAKEA
jgi:hypothetical protein